MTYYTPEFAHSKECFPTRRSQPPHESSEDNSASKPRCFEVQKIGENVVGAAIPKIQLKFRLFNLAHSISKRIVYYVTRNKT